MICHKLNSDISKKNVRNSLKNMSLFLNIWLEVGLRQLQTHKSTFFFDQTLCTYGVSSGFTHCTKVRIGEWALTNTPFCWDISAADST